MSHPVARRRKEQRRLRRLICRLRRLEALGWTLRYVVGRHNVHVHLVPPAMDINHPGSPA